YNHVKVWTCATTCDTDFLAKALGPKWEGHLYVNSEVTPPDTSNAQSIQLYKAIFHKYGSAVSGGIGSFSEFGFAIGEIAVKALDTIKGPYTIASVNKAFHNVMSYDTGVHCQQWTFGNYPLHIANNMDYTVTPKNGQMVPATNVPALSKCLLISAKDPQIAQYRKVAGTAPLAPGQS
ncbi:MAG: hypothetical protein ACRDNJ_12075, partial [Solirubrobacteraceae bacterium]